MTYDASPLLRQVARQEGDLEQEAVAGVAEVAAGQLGDAL